jgi:hypothetical protein
MNNNLIDYMIFNLILLEDQFYGKNKVFEDFYDTYFPYTINDVIVILESLKGKNFEVNDFMINGKIEKEYKDKYRSKEKLQEILRNF